MYSFQKIKTESGFQNELDAKRPPILLNLLGDRKFKGRLAPFLFYHENQWKREISAPDRAVISI